YDIARLRAAGPGLFAGTGLWRYAPVLPIPDPAHRVTLGEGGTPLLDCPRLARELGVRRLILTYDGSNPTRTGTDRSSTTVPDVVVAPVAVGETFIATARGFREMREAGWIARAPLMVAAQATRANAVARAFRDGTAITPLTIGYTVAEGLAAGDPGKKGEWVLRLLRDGKGLAGDPEGDEVRETQRRLAQVEGVWAGPTGVATLAVLARLLAQKQLDPAQTICAIISETGLKTEGGPPTRTGVAFDFDSLRRLVAERLA